MICKKCGNQIQENMKFCTSCGEPVVLEQPINTTQQQVIQPNNIGTSQLSVQNTIVQPTPSVQQTQPIYNQNSMKSGKGMLKTILMGIIKPVSNFKESEAELTSTSNSAIIAGIISVMVMVINLVITVCTTLFTKSTQTCFMGYCYGEELTFTEKLKTIQWWPLIWQYIVIPAGIILLIAGIYFIMSLIFKKNIKFGKLLGLVSLSSVPAFTSVILLSPILGLMWTPLSIIISITGVLYSITILTILVYKEFNFEYDDKFLLFNLISVFAFIIVVLLIVNTMVQQSFGSLTSLF